MKSLDKFILGAATVGALAAGAAAEKKADSAATFDSPAHKEQLAKTTDWEGKDLVLKDEKGEFVVRNGERVYLEKKNDAIGKITSAKTETKGEVVLQDTKDISESAARVADTPDDDQ
jgi:hypothetical protein